MENPRCKQRRQESHLSHDAIAVDRRLLLTTGFWLALSGCVTMKKKMGPLKTGQRFRIIGGDGDPDFFSKPRDIRLAEADWFQGHVQLGDALLFLVDDPEYADRYVALTSHTLARLPEHLSQHGWASVVVHDIRNPSHSFDGEKSDDAFAIGMGVVERV